MSKALLAGRLTPSRIVDTQVRGQQDWWAVCEKCFMWLSSSGYMPFEGQPIHLTTAQREELEERARSHALSAGFVQRAKIDGARRSRATAVDERMPVVTP